MAGLDSKILVMVLAGLLLAYLIARHRQKVWVPFTLALVMAALWSLYFRYEYDGKNIFLFNRLNIYPLTLWTIGLTVLQFVSHKLSSRYRLALAIIFYLLFLLSAEAIGYYLLNIRLDSQYTSLLNLGVIHAPTSMKIFYMFAGPAYLLLLDWLNKKTRQPNGQKIKG